jgi:hypothetical protein
MSETPDGSVILLRWPIVNGVVIYMATGPDRVDEFLALAPPWNQARKEVLSWEWLPGCEPWFRDLYEKTPDQYTISGERFKCRSVQVGCAFEGTWTLWRLPFDPPAPPPPPPAWWWN